MQETETYVYSQYEAPSAKHPLGTDTNGMDMLTRHHGTQLHRTGNDQLRDHVRDQMLEDPAGYPDAAGFCS